MFTGPSYPLLESIDSTNMDDESRRNSLKEEQFLHYSFQTNHKLDLCCLLLSSETRQTNSNYNCESAKGFLTLEMKSCKKFKR